LNHFARGIAWSTAGRIPEGFASCHKPFAYQSGKIIRLRIAVLLVHQGLNRDSDLAGGTANPAGS
jgi:hypothetical protein